MGKVTAPSVRRGFFVEICFLFNICCTFVAAASVSTGINLGNLDCAGKWGQNATHIMIVARCNPPSAGYHFDVEKVAASYVPADNRVFLQAADRRLEFFRIIRLFPGGSSSGADVKKDPGGAGLQLFAPVRTWSSVRNNIVNSVQLPTVNAGMSRIFTVPKGWNKNAAGSIVFVSFEKLHAGFLWARLVAQGPDLPRLTEIEVAEFASNAGGWTPAASGSSPIIDRGMFDFSRHNEKPTQRASAVTCKLEKKFYCAWPRDACVEQCADCPGRAVVPAADLFWVRKLHKSNLHHELYKHMCYPTEPPTHVLDNLQQACNAGEQLVFKDLDLRKGHVAGQLVFGKQFAGPWLHSPLGWLLYKDTLSSEKQFLSPDAVIWGNPARFDVPFELSSRSGALTLVPIDGTEPVQTKNRARVCRVAVVDRRRPDVQAQDLNTAAVDLDCREKFLMLSLNVTHQASAKHEGSVAEAPSGYHLQLFLGEDGISTGEPIAEFLLVRKNATQGVEMESTQKMIIESGAGSWLLPLLELRFSGLDSATSTNGIRNRATSMSSDYANSSSTVISYTLHAFVGDVLASEPILGRVVDRADHNSSCTVSEEGTNAEVVAPKKNSVHRQEL